MTTTIIKNSSAFHRQWPDVTLATVLQSREDLLVEYAITMGVAIDSLREHIKTLPGQTQLRNVTKSLTLDQTNDAGFIGYIEWLKNVADRLHVESIGELYERLAPFISTKIVANIGGTTDQSYIYEIGNKEERDPWREVRVGTVHSVLDRVNDLVNSVQKPFGSRSHREVLKYIEDRILASHKGIATDVLIQPAAYIVAVALSTKVDYVSIRTQMWHAKETANPTTKSSRQRRLGEPHDTSMCGQSQDHDGNSSRYDNWVEVIDRISQTVEDAKRQGIPVLIAFNAPLGWPATMTDALAEHEAGALLAGTSTSLDDDARSEESKQLSHGHSERDHEKQWRNERNSFFRRKTEQIVREARGGGSFGPNGLDVGADKSARTAHQALRILNVVRTRTKSTIPVVTDDCGPITQTSAIEVYTSWPRTPTDDEFEETTHVDVPVVSPRVRPKRNRWEYNASTAAGEAVAFLEGRANCPRDHGLSNEIARKEGWIWFSRNTASSE